MHYFFPFLGLVFSICLLLNGPVSAQSYTYYPTGDTTDIIVTDAEPILILAGGGGDWEFCSVLNGTLNRDPGESVACIVPVLESDTSIGTLRCYPNPVRGKLRLWESSLRPARLNIYGATEQLHRRLATDRLEWSTADWPAGVYVVELIDAQGQRYVGKLIVL